MRKKSYLILAIVFQCAIIAAVPGPKLFTQLTGKTVTIKTVPVDPYDFMSGYHVILRYEISQPRSLEFTASRHQKHSTLYNILIEDENGVWNSQAIHSTYPEDIPDGAVVIKGKYQHGRIEYGLGKFFIPEENRQEIEHDLRMNQRQALVDIKVDRFGNAALLRLRIDDRVYDY